MNRNGNKMENVKIAYVGGGSRGWAWKLMSDLAACPDMSGQVYLYDIDFEAAQNNEWIGNQYRLLPDCSSSWEYIAVESQKQALENADFVVLSILPGTFDEMESDVHAPEEFGIYQSVGDSTGPGGIVRAMRTVPIYEQIASAIREYCPEAWVINYTNPMTLCVKTLYRVFPQIRAFGCCHEVFGTQKLLRNAMEDICGVFEKDRSKIRVNPVGVNHFTWLTEARYCEMDLFPVYREFSEKYAECGYTAKLEDNWMNNSFRCCDKVKMDLFLRYGSIAAAGDRHLAEFMDGDCYLKDPEQVRSWGFGLTSVAWRKNKLKERLQQSLDLRNGTKKLEIKTSGEEGVEQMRAILGLRLPLVTNVNLPNVGQIPNLPLGAVVETNAVFSSGSVKPVMAGEVPHPIRPLVERICLEQEKVSCGIANRDLSEIFDAFASDPLVKCSREDAKKLFKTMVENTASYLDSYDLSKFNQF